jgi:dUTP pyrophosphatase
MTLQHKTMHSAGADLSATKKTIVPGYTTVLVPTGERMPKDIPSGFFGLLALRSSVALKTPLLLKNGVGIIDRDYSDEIMIMVCNMSPEDYVIEQGDRIAQLIIVPYIFAGAVLDVTRAGGFGSTNK